MTHDLKVTVFTCALSPTEWDGGAADPILKNKCAPASASREYHSQVLAMTVSSASSENRSAVIAQTQRQQLDDALHLSAGVKL